jgi:hypothetical protein
MLAPIRVALFLFNRASASWNGRLASRVMPVSDDSGAGGLQVDGGNGPKSSGTVDLSVQISEGKRENFLDGIILKAGCGQCLIP